MSGGYRKKSKFKGFEKGVCGLRYKNIEGCVGYSDRICPNCKGCENCCSCNLLKMVE